MKHSRLAIIGLVTASLGTGIGLGRVFSVPVVQAQKPTTPTGFQVTAALNVPDVEGMGLDGKMLRLEDKEYGIVCYVSATNGFSFGCAKK